MGSQRTCRRWVIFDQQCSPHRERGHLSERVRPRLDSGYQPVTHQLCVSGAHEIAEHILPPPPDAEAREGLAHEPELERFHRATQPILTAEMGLATAAIRSDRRGRARRDQHHQRTERNRSEGERGEADRAT